MQLQVDERCRERAVQGEIAPDTTELGIIHDGDDFGVACA